MAASVRRFHVKVLLKKAVLKNFAKYLWRSIFLVRLQTVDCRLFSRKPVNDYLWLELLFIHKSKNLLKVYSKNLFYHLLFRTQLLNEDLQNEEPRFSLLSFKCFFPP